MDFSGLALGLPKPKLLPGEAESTQLGQVPRFWTSRLPGLGGFSLDGSDVASVDEKETPRTIPPVFASLFNPDPCQSYPVRAWQDCCARQAAMIVYGYAKTKSENGKKGASISSPCHLQVFVPSNPQVELTLTASGLDL